MNSPLFQSILRFVALVLLQGVIIHNVDLGMYIHPMIYPLFIILLPIEINFYLLLSFGFAIGISVDAFSSTFGLNASASVFLAYIRPLVLKTLQPRDGYENIVIPNIQSMGLNWFVYYAGIMIFLHHFWFFSLEVFNFLEIFPILLKVIISGLISLCIFILFQYLFRSQKQRSL